MYNRFKDRLALVPKGKDRVDEGPHGGVDKGSNRLRFHQECDEATGLLPRIQSERGRHDVVLGAG